MPRWHRPPAKPPEPPRVQSPRPEPAQTSYPPPVSASVPLYPNLVQSIGTYVGAVYLIASYSKLNEMLVMHAGVSTHVQTVAGAVALGLALCTGAALRGLQARAVKFWIMVLVWMLVCVPFSSWRGASAFYVSHAAPYHLGALAVCAFAVSPKQVRILLCAFVGGTACLAAFCFLFGQMDAGRLIIPDTAFANPNEVGLRLLLGGAAMVFLLAYPNGAARLAGAGGLIVLMALLFRTGSRGSFLSAIAVMVVLITMSGIGRSKIVVAGAAALVALVLLIVTPRDTASRLLTLFSDTPEEEQLDADANAGEEFQAEKALASEYSRKELLKKAALLTVQHPLFGVGPDQFPQTIWVEGKERGQHVAAQRPHNSYLQFSSETGIPGALFWAGSLLLSIIASRRAYRLALAAGDRAAAAQSLGIFTILVAYSFNTLFVHVPFSDAASLTGLAAANSLAAERWFRPAAGPARGEHRPAAKHTQLTYR